MLRSLTLLALVAALLLPAHALATGAPTDTVDVARHASLAVASPVLLPEAVLESPGSPADFGSRVSVSGDRALVADRYDDGGTAYVFVYDGSQPAGEQWRLEATLAVDGLRLGEAIAIDGDVALVSASPDFPQNTDRVLVYRRDDTGWTQEAVIALDAGGSFGRRVELDGGRALIRAQRASSDPTVAGPVVSVVYAFDGAQPPGDQWSVEDVLPGSPSALDGDRAMTSVGTAVSSFVYDGSRPDGRQWRLEATLSPSDGSPADFFGFAVALEGDHALIGAPLDDGVFKNDGSVYAFRFDASEPGGGPWKEEAKLTAPNARKRGGFGWSIAIEGGLAVIGEPLYETDLTTFSKPQGRAFVFALQGSEWTRQAELSDGVNSPCDSFGDAVAIAGTRAYVGAPGVLGDCPGPNRVHVFELDPDTDLAADAERDEVAERSADLGATDATASAQATSVAFELSTFPNPTANRAAVAFSVEAAGAVRLSVVDALGREVAVLADGPVEAGRHQAELDATSWPAGIYLVRLATADGRVATQRLTRLR